MQLLSLVIVAKNEEENIERCIRSVPFADEVIVIDSESTDRTKEIAESLGARVIQKPWMGFQKQKQFATDAAKNSWVLNLDADEQLSLELQREINQLLAGKLEKYDAFEVPRLSYYLGRWIRHGGWYPDYQTRLYNKEVCRWLGGEVHEYVEANTKGRLKNPIHHFVFQSLSHQVLTNDRYSSLGAKNLLHQDKPSTLLHLIFKPVGKFFECYVIKRGFLDGKAGFVIAVGAAYSMFLKHAKVWESRIENHP